ncbi:MAG: hypothetical protein DWG76_07235 [Chloroflexi bacterium]|nr:hypothetical protein [Chloroflexota bacterium]
MTRDAILDGGPEDSLGVVLGAWRNWLAGALLGAFAAWGVFAIFPPDFQARATVAVDQNLEEAWTYFPDRQLFQFSRRETARLAEVAWSDEVLAQVVMEVEGTSVAALRDGALKLSQPGDGGWHFYGLAANGETAQALAGAWAEAFVEQARAATVVSAEMEGLRADLNELAANDVTRDDEEVQALMGELAALEEKGEGISPYTEVSLSQSANLPLARRTSLASYLLAGSIAGALLAGLDALLRRPQLI